MKSETLIATLSNVTVSANTALFLVDIVSLLPTTHYTLLCMTSSKIASMHFRKAGSKTKRLPFRCVKLMMCVLSR